jgi:pimeloyl-ACP methyl ester carboxylesterase
MSASADSPIYPQVKKIDGLSIRYAESEPREVSAILLSPWPESLYTFEQMWSRLAEHAHLVAIDLPGFGQSQRRGELLKSSTMGEFVAHAVEAFGLTDRVPSVPTLAHPRCCSRPVPLPQRQRGALMKTGPPAYSALAAVRRACHANGAAPAEFTVAGRPYGTARDRARHTPSSRRWTRSAI